MSFVQQEIHSIFIKEEPVEFETKYTKNDQDDTDLEPCKSEYEPEHTNYGQGEDEVSNNWQQYQIYFGFCIYRKQSGGNNR